MGSVRCSFAHSTVAFPHIAAFARCPESLGYPPLGPSLVHHHHQLLSNASINIMAPIKGDVAIFWDLSMTTAMNDDIGEGLNRIVKLSAEYGPIKHKTAYLSPPWPKDEDVLTERLNTLDVNLILRRIVILVMKGKTLVKVQEPDSYWPLKVAPKKRGSKGTKKKGAASKKPKDLKRKKAKQADAKEKKSSSKGKKKNADPKKANSQETKKQRKKDAQETKSQKKKKSTGLKKSTSKGKKANFQPKKAQKGSRQPVRRSARLSAKVKAAT
ncbi:hypothetical protein D9611_009384 [Ephemerocybe angulata]|uniref:Uncharacterized protein n=1 Tax=Ephemerocybe angulata TaxID=980116 RepID=A0A8H5BHB2_9AGAR|nr:hypothetical protein D9611_009384 [Tulosesus angulatus]